jgi:hypothetical protein
MSVGKIDHYSLPFNNVVATGVATAMITPGRTIESLTLKLGGTFTKAMIELIKLKANGKVFFEGSADQIHKINSYKGEAANAAFLPLRFIEKAGDTDLDREIGAFDTSQGIVNITAEVTIVGATAPVLTPILTESAQQRDGSGKPAPYAPIMSKVLRYPFAQATGGTLPAQLPFGPQSGAVIKRVHVFSAGGLMTGATVKQDGTVIHESLKDENEFDQVSWKRVPQANCYTIDFVKDGKIKDALDTRDARSLEWLFTFSAADSGFIVVEYLDTLGNL